MRLVFFSVEMQLGFTVILLVDRNVITFMCVGAGGGMTEEIYQTLFISAVQPRQTFWFVIDTGVTNNIDIGGVFPVSHGSVTKILKLKQLISDIHLSLILLNTCDFPTATCQSFLHEKGLPDFL